MQRSSRLCDCCRIFTEKLYAIKCLMSGASDRSDKVPLLDQLLSYNMTSACDLPASWQKVVLRFLIQSSERAESLVCYRRKYLCHLEDLCILTEELRPPGMLLRPP